MKITEQAYRLLETRYKSRNENVEDIYPRVARAIAKHAPDVANGFGPLEDEFLRMMEDADFLPNSPCIRNAGYSNMNKACFILPVEDSIQGIYKALLESAQIFKMGGGVGYNFSDLREEGAPLSAGGTSSGVLSFMNMFNASTEAVKQGGFRRGACVSQDTRALTRTGWKPYDELKVGDEILAFCPETNTLKFQPILKMNVFDWDGEMISFKNKSMDFLFTPNHRVIYKTLDLGKTYSICRADSVPYSSIYVPICDLTDDEFIICMSEIQQKHISKRIYIGKVWCPTVESGFWVAERKGYVCITGNSMGVLDYDHPEIINFIQEKGKYGRLNNFNVSVMLDDDFMKRVQTDDEIYLKSRLDRRRTVQTMKARDLFNLISIYAWENGDPGVLFLDRINKDNPFAPEQMIRATNPCGEVPLFPYESCCLGSINLSHCVTDDGDLDKEKLKDLVHLGTLFLIGMNKATQFTIKECYTAQERYFRLGLGVMGYADMLMKMHILYDSPEAMNTVDKIGKILKLSSKYSPVSIATRSIAPTGSLSILANCSSGIEPIFSANYERHTTAGVFSEQRDNEYLRTAHDVSPEWHLKTLARWQKWIDNGVSKTINMPYNCSQSDVANIYMKAWEMGCKGVTIFRDNCRRGEQVYKARAPKCDGESCTL